MRADLLQADTSNPGVAVGLLISPADSLCKRNDERFKSALAADDDA